MTKSKRIRAYLAKNPHARAKELQERFGASPAMCYRLIRQVRDNRISAATTAYLDSLTIDPNSKPPVDNVNHPQHYKIGGIETIDFIEAKGLDNHYHLANAIKYISRAPYKNNYTEDLKKAIWYLQREIDKKQPQA